MSDTPTSQPALPLPAADTDVPLVLDFGEAGTYELEQCLGRGGMGEVYRARQVGAAGFSQLVAIKRLRPGSRRWEARSFVDEARILSRLHHENIACVYAFHEWQGGYYLVMEYIEGRSLHALLGLARKKGHRFSESVACAVMAGVADALHYAHEATDEAGRPLHVIHRDVSPANIVIANTGRVVLLDFGVALSKQEGRIATRTGAAVIKGKAPYLSPEQVKHLPLDARSDLFSVGTILVEMLTGEAPFGWAADFHTLRRIDAVTPEYVASLLPGVSKPLRALCQKLLAHHPDQRFATGREVAMALRHCAGLGEGQQRVRAEVERVRALPEAKAPLVAAEAVAARALSEVKHARYAVTLFGSLMLATLAFASWYVPRGAVPVHSSPLLQEPAAVSLPLPPEKSMAPSPSAPPPPGSRLVGEPKRKNGAAVAAGPAHRRDGVAADDARQSKKDDGRGSLALGAERQGEEDAAVGSGRLAAALEEKLATVSASYALVYGEATSPDHALAALLAASRADLTSYFLFRKRKLQVRGLSAEVQIFLPQEVDDASKVAVVVELTNPNDAPAWELNEARIEPASDGWAEQDVAVASAMVVKPVAVRVLPRVIPPGQKGRVALVFDRASAGLDKVDGTARLLELLRNDRVELAVELNPGDVRDSRSALERWWSR